MGDVLSLIERAEKAYDRDKAEAFQKKVKKAEFDLEDFREQLTAVKKMGSMVDVLGMIPGVKKLFKGAELDGRRRRAQAHRGHHQLDDQAGAPEPPDPERHRAESASRSGSGTSVAEVNRLIKQFEQTKR